MRRTCLAAALHDPEGRLLPLTSRLLDVLRRVYGGISVAATKETERRLLEVLSRSGVSVHFEEPGLIGAARRKAVAGALAVGAGSVHYCDFDRVLFWQSLHPEELERVAGSHARRPFMFLGRGAREWRSYPAAQRVTESATNAAVSSLVGRKVDATAGSCVLMAETASVILEHSTEPTNATDAEWPAIVFAVFGAGAFSFRRCRGLAFETPTFFEDEIRRAGSLEAWIHDRYDSPEMWEQRAELTHNSISALARVMRVLAT